MDDFLLKAALALAVGGIVGLERGKKMRIVGLRTFALLCFLGMLASALTGGFSSAALAGFLGVFALSAIFYYYQGHHKHTGLTTPLMLPFTFLLGTVIGMGYYFEAGVTAIAAAFLLVEKQELESVEKRVTKEEFLDLLLFAVIAFVVYPQLPLAPLQLGPISFNARFFWLLVVLVSSVSFVAHLLSKFVRKGALVYSALLGGMLSSNATVLTLLDKATHKRLFKPILFFAALASMAVNAFVVLVTDPGLFAESLPFFVLVEAALAYLAFSSLKRGDLDEGLTLTRHPISIKLAFEFALVFFAVNTLISLVAPAGATGMAAGAFLGALVSTTAAFAAVAYAHASGAVSAETAFYAYGAMLAAAWTVKTAILWFKDRRALAEMPSRLLLLAAAAALGLYLCVSKPFYIP
ncbi:hypothetical protein COX86_03300 [Candidatus Micrarchaeota archaeon CG_4_10_14_0_2_um_filter_60_11]|nr:MAG: hypothetical protein AUJ16_03340 [Candidatus Micrarchaeota archaeon CG1_02_60_51]PIN95800.1 MAG: hypothetical protein COU39_04180 [Candidatus Micrarchaeota archaeon CG10_big_fil_rev_8_21_14_0_10_60_32]PIO01761.1 MAG: hypothetical protein COT58_03300 [Candidatus Micrarchaeota archaeon CG09_land_8_20_14_0_10_60_16]PIY91122.1 MAG: hypothetical protein COY71_04820 [Candidatus Micrarchaeota archaeon CG_4_10_14_0_8_um_filter_60_7]PIZ90758.1 MAG: hypothetical protein COX86_03300 [Candidatus Mi